MRRLLGFLLALAVVFVAADFGLRYLSEYWVAQRLQRSLDLPSRPSVSLGGFPYIPRLVSGDLPTVTVRTGTLTVEGVAIQRIRLSLHDVHFSTRLLLYGKSNDIRADGGDGVAVIRGIAVTATTVGSVRVRFEGGDAIVTSERLQRSFKATASPDGSSLVLRSTDAALPISFDVKIPLLLPEQRYTQLTLAGSEARLAFVLVNPRFEVGA